MQKNQWSDTTALGNMATGLSIYSMIPYFYGMVDTNVGCVICMLCSLPFVIIAVVGCFKNQDVVGGTATAVLTGICLLGNLYHALINMFVETAGSSESIQTALVMSSGAVNLGAVFFCGVVAWLAWKVNKAQSVAVMFPTIALFLLFLEHMGIVGLSGAIPGTLFVVFGTWMIYSGCAAMVHQVTGREMLPYIVVSDK